MSVMGKPVTKQCGAAAFAAFTESPSEAIRALQNIHPPAHVLIIGEANDVYKYFRMARKSGLYTRGVTC